MLIDNLKDWVKKNYKDIKNPVYVYNKDVIIKTCQHFTEIPYQNKSIHFATMANCNPDFLQIIKQAGLDVFVNSQLHLEEVKNVGFTNSQIIFTASSISKEMMECVYREGIQINLDSLTQLEFWVNKYPDRNIGIRCNIENKFHRPKTGRAGSFIGENSRLGLTEDEINSIKTKEQINGLHIYVGTDIIDIDYFTSFYESLIAISDQFPNLEYLDFGGGFGIDTKNNFDFELYGKKITEIMNRFSAKRNKSIKLILEPGRIIGGEAGFFICKVTDIKFRNGTQYIGVNASSTQFPRPLLYPNESNHPTYLFDKSGNLKNTKEKDTKINGCSTYSRDFLSHKTSLSEAKIDDIIVLGNAGSYCSSMYTEFLGFKKPKEIFI